MDYVYEIEDVLPKEICEIIIKRYDKDSRKYDSKIGQGVIDKWRMKDILFKNTKKVISMHSM